jgi:hypothetical protein
MKIKVSEIRAIIREALEEAMLSSPSKNIRGGLTAPNPEALAKYAMKLFVGTKWGNRMSLDSPSDPAFQRYLHKELSDMGVSDDVIDDTRKLVAQAWTRSVAGR